MKSAYQCFHFGLRHFGVGTRGAARVASGVGAGYNPQSVVVGGQSETGVVQYDHPDGGQAFAYYQTGQPDHGFSSMEFPKLKGEPDHLVGLAKHGILNPTLDTLTEMIRSGRKWHKDIESEISVSIIYLYRSQEKVFSLESAISSG